MSTLQALQPSLTQPWDRGQLWLLAGLLLLLVSLFSRFLSTEARARVARLVTPVLVAAAAVLLLATAVWFLRSTFMLYDDEGYVLFAMRGFAGHGALYDRVYSQYGPFFHLLADGLHRLGWPIDNMGARSLAMVCWGGSAAACFALAWRLTRSLAASGLAMAAAFIHLWQMANEPSHPGGLIVLLLAVGVLAGFHIRERPLGFGLVTGLVAAALVLTKVNVGLFFVAGAGLWYLLHARLPLSDTLRRTAVALLAALMPWLLMRGLLHEGWVRNFALISSLSFTAATLAVRPPRGYHAPAGMLAAAAGGFLLLAGLTVGLMLARHTSLRGLLDGVLLSPLRMPTIFTSPINWRPGAVAGAFLSLAFALSLDRLGSRTRLCLLLGGRFAVLTGFAASLAGLLPMNTLAYASNVGIASSWLFVAPLERRSDSSPALAWLLLIGMLQILHAYPVAGSQLGWGSLLWIPLAACGGHEAWLWLRQRTNPVAGQLAVLGARLPIILTAIAALNFALMGWNRQATGEALLLPGAENIIVPQHFASTARVIQNNLVLHCDSVFSAPGMFSFNLWSELPAPTLANATHWFSLLSERQKQELLQALCQDPRPGIVIQRGLLDYMRERSLPVDGPVMQYLREEFSPVLQANHYELWLRKSQAAAIVGVARLATPQQELLPLTLNLASVGQVELAGFQLRQFDATDSRVLVRWSADNFLVRITPLHRDGTPRGPGQLCRPPLKMTGLNRLELLVRNCPVPPSSGDLVLVLQDQAGNRIGEALFLRDETPAP